MFLSVGSVKYLDAKLLSPHSWKVFSVYATSLPMIEGVHRDQEQQHTHAEVAKYQKLPQKCTVVIFEVCNLGCTIPNISPLSIGCHDAVTCSRNSSWQEKNDRSSLTQLLCLALIPKHHATDDQSTDLSSILCALWCLDGTEAHWSGC